MPFAQEVQKILVHEGGYSFVPGDRGGETYRGITRKNFPNWAGWAIVDKYKPLKHNQIINDAGLNTLVATFYKKNFWDSLNIDLLPTPVQGLLFDFAINSGTGTAAKAFQKVIRDTTGAKIIVDGNIGKGTISAANQANQKELFNKFKTYRANYYQAIVKNDPGQKKFYDGWINRLNTYEFKAAAISFGVFFFGALILIYLNKD